MSGSDWGVLDTPEHSQSLGVWLCQGCCRRANQHRSILGGRFPPGYRLSQGELACWGLALCRGNPNCCVEQNVSFDQE